MVDVKTLTYEQARAELDEVVASLERGQLALDEVMVLWERGEKLVAHCRDFLIRARETVEAKTQPPVTPPF